MVMILFVVVVLFFCLLVCSCVLLCVLFWCGLGMVNGLFIRCFEMWFYIDVMLFFIEIIVY